MTDEHARAHGLAGAQVAHTEPMNFQEEDAGFGTNLRIGTESRPDGDNDTDDIGTYPPIGQFRSGYAGDPS